MAAFFYTHFLWAEEQKYSHMNFDDFPLLQKETGLSTKITPKKPFKKIVLLQREFWVFGKLLLHCTHIEVE